MIRGQVFYYTSIIFVLLLTSALNMASVTLHWSIAGFLFFTVIGSFFIRIFAIKPTGKFLTWFSKDAKWINKKLEKFS